MTEKEKRTILDMRAAGKQYKEISAELGIEVSALKVFVHRQKHNDAGERILVICSFSERDQKYLLPKGYTEEEAALLLCNYPETGTTGILRPYEVRVFQWGSE